VRSNDKFKKVMGGERGIKNMEKGFRKAIKKAYKRGEAGDDIRRYYS